MSKDIADSIEVDCPIRTVYNQWTQFEDFPRFMDGVESVQQLDDTTLRWKARIGGVSREWDARIVEQRPDECIVWQATSGSDNRGEVRFTPLGAARTQVSLRIEFQPQGFVEKAGEKLGMVTGQAKEDLRRFKEFIEARGAETGAWRGSVDGGTATTPRAPGGITSTGSSSVDSSHPLDLPSEPTRPGPGGRPGS